MRKKWRCLWVGAVAEDEFNPVGTIAVMAILALLITILWLGIYFGVFLPRGGIS